MSLDELKRQQRERAYEARRSKCTSVPEAARPGLIDEKFKKMESIVSSKSAETAKKIIKWLMFDRASAQQWSLRLRDAELYSEVIIRVSETERRPLVCNVDLVRESKSTHMSLAVALKPHMLDIRSESASSIAANGAVDFKLLLDRIIEKSAVFIKNIMVDAKDEVSADRMLTAALELLVGLGMLDMESWVVSDASVYSKHVSMVEVSRATTSLSFDNKVRAIQARDAISIGMPRLSAYIKQVKDIKKQRRELDDLRIREEDDRRRRRESENAQQKASCAVQ
jgi:hypothetical protein